MRCLANHEEDPLYYLLHDKGHVVKPGRHIPVLDRKITSRAPMALYRGLSSHEHALLLLGKVVGDIITAPTYWSVSEHRGIAKTFAESYRTKRVVQFNKAKAFCLWQWGIDGLDSLKATDPEAYNREDGDFLKETYQEEAEWIMGFNTFKVAAVDGTGYPTTLLDITT